MVREVFDVISNETLFDNPDHDAWRLSAAHIWKTHLLLCRAKSDIKAKSQLDGVVSGLYDRAVSLLTSFKWMTRSLKTCSLRQKGEFWGDKKIDSGNAPK